MSVRLGKALVCAVGGKSVGLKDMEKSASFKVSGMLRGRIKGNSVFTYSIHTNVQYYTTIIHTYCICYNICICTYF